MVAELGDQARAQRRRPRGGLAWLAGVLAMVTTATLARASEADLRAKGEYLLRAGACSGCHTDVENEGPFLAGGAGMVTAFGVFYPPNITPDPMHGIGRWTEDDLYDALHFGVGPGAVHLYPAFPYTAYTGIVREDVRALYAYLMSVPPVPRPSREHDLPWYMRFRILNRVWNWLYFDPGEFEPQPDRSAEWNRGAYLATALAHCQECHSPRNLAGALDRHLLFAGTVDGPGGDTVPNITPDKETGIGYWDADELVRFLSEGVTPDYDTAGGLMAEMIDEGLQHLDESDLHAIATYILSLPPVHHEVD